MKKCVKKLGWENGDRFLTGKNCDETKNKFRKKIVMKNVMENHVMRNSLWWKNTRKNGKIEQNKFLTKM